MRQTIQSILVLSALIVTASACEKTTAGVAGGTLLTIFKPSDQSLKRGESNQIQIKIERKDFRDPVTITFLQLPPGVVLVDKDKQVSAEETSATFTLRADPAAAAVTGHRVEVVAKGPGSLEAKESFKITVKE